MSLREIVTSSRTTELTSAPISNGIVEKQEKPQTVFASAYPSLSASVTEGAGSLSARSFQVPAQFTESSLDELDELQDEFQEEGTPKALVETPARSTSPTPFQLIMAAQHEFQTLQEAIRKKPALEEMQLLGQSVNGVVKKWEAALLEYRKDADPALAALLEESLKSATRRTLPPISKPTPAPVQAPTLVARIEPVAVPAPEVNLPVREIVQLQQSFVALQEETRKKPSLEDMRRIVQKGQGIIDTWQTKLLEYRKAGDATIIAKLEESFVNITKRSLPVTSRYPSVASEPLPSLSDLRISGALARGKEIEAMQARLAAKAEKTPAKPLIAAVPGPEYPSLVAAVSAVQAKPACAMSLPVAPEPDLKPYPILDSAPLNSLNDKALEQAIAKPKELDKALEGKAQANFERNLRKAEGTETLLDKLRSRFWKGS